MGVRHFASMCLKRYRTLYDRILLEVRLKRHVKIILVQMNYPSSPFSGSNIPVGLGYIAEQLDVHSIDYEVSDLSIETKNLFFRKIAKFSPEYVGLSMMSLDVYQHYTLAKEIKTLFPDVRVVAGGAHISFVQAKALEDCLAIDFGVVYEGEQTIVELLDGRPYHDIKGLLYRTKTGEILYTGHRQFMEHLDQLQFPRYRKFKLGRYGRKVALTSSRGCPFNCTFCGAFLSMGKRWRARSAQNLNAEIQFWHNKGYKHFDFIDSNFFMSKQRVLELCDCIEETNTSITISSDGMRAKDADRELLARLKKYGLKRIAIGFESANDDILQSIKKGETVAELEACLQLLDELDIAVIAFFIIGLPGETPQHVLNSFKLAMKYHNICNAFFFNPNPLPGTELYLSAKENNILKATESQIYSNIGGMGNESLLETIELSSKDRMLLSETAKEVSRLVEINYLFAHGNHKKNTTVSLEKERQKIKASIEQSFAKISTPQPHVK